VVLYSKHLLGGIMQHCVKAQYTRRFWVDAETEEEAISVVQGKIDEDWYVDFEDFEYEVMEIIEE
jgi:hypothetical protein